MKYIEKKYGRKNMELEKIWIEKIWIFCTYHQNHRISSIVQNTINDHSFDLKNGKKIISYLKTCLVKFEND